MPSDAYELQPCERSGQYSVPRCTRCSLLFVSRRRYHSASLRPQFDARRDGSRRFPQALPGRMLINLLPDFFAVLNSTDRVAAYQRYFEAHRRLLEPTGTTTSSIPTVPTFATSSARRRSPIAPICGTMLERTDVVALARSTEQQCGASARAGRRRRCRAHGRRRRGKCRRAGRRRAGHRLRVSRAFHLRRQPGHAGTRARSGADSALAGPRVRSRGSLHLADQPQRDCDALIDEAGGYYSYWETGRLAPLRELLVNEGLAVQVSQAISPGHAAWEYFGFGRRQYARVRELNLSSLAPSPRTSIAQGWAFDCAISPAA